MRKMTAAPSSAPSRLPRPPVIEMPPSATAASASKMNGVTKPASASAWWSWATIATPPRPAIAPPSV